MNIKNRISIVFFSIFLTILFVSCKTEKKVKHNGETETKEIQKEESEKKEILIGETVWMLKNLDTDKFKEGTQIIEAKTNEEWIKAGQEEKPAWCYYNNTGTANGAGKLYNWYAVHDSRGLAPEGYHVSNQGDWKTLKEYLNFERKKYFSVEEWQEKGTNLKQFLAKTFGARGAGGGFVDGNMNGWWVESHNKNSETQWYQPGEDNGKYQSIQSSMFSNYKTAGHFVRCVKN